MQRPQVAIVGFSFRLPGTSRERFWDSLKAGHDLVTKVEASRWNQEALLHPSKTEPGRTYTFAAGSLGDVAAFDAGFFGISPREAAQMDPQQRILLELTWEALEAGEIRPSDLSGSRVGVYVGLSSVDYAYRRMDDLASIDSTTMTGNTGSIVANRVSYFFNLKGPSLAVDTACSSSLVAFHMACQSILSGECVGAIAGGVSLHLHPMPFIGFSKASMLSPTGRCAVFDASADGYVRAEGAAAFVLKDLACALADGDHVLAVVAASRTNCDGRKTGLTVPSHESQGALLRDVYARAGIDPAQIDYLEAHGTGTPVGDPIEARAIGEALAQSRASSKPLLIGSVKSNLGHLEAASGAAGLVKALHCLQHRAVPPSIHFSKPNPNIDLQGWNLRVATELTPLDGRKELVVGINSFGFGGVNAHVILKSPPRQAQAGSRPHRRSVPLVLSARSEAALRQVARSYAEFIGAHPELPVGAVARAVALQRDWHEHRCVLLASDRKTVAKQLGELAAGHNPPGTIAGKSVSRTTGVGFVFAGNGAQWAGMGRALLEESRTFRTAVDAVDRLVCSRVGWSVRSELERDDAASRFESTEIAQPALFAVQVGLTRMLLGAGIAPAVVLGHSVGEVAAAWASGALALDQAVEVICKRSIEQGRTRGAGGMTAVALAERAMTELLAAHDAGRSLVISAVNSPASVTLAGPVESLRAIEEMLAQTGIRFSRLALDYAFHSPAMDAVRASLVRSLKDLRPRQARIPFLSTVTGSELPGQALDAEYWWHNVRRPVAFESAIREAIRRGIGVFVEISPHAILRPYVAQCLAEQGSDGRTIPMMTRSRGDLPEIREAIGQIIVAGAAPVPARRSSQRGARIPLPAYPWQRERHWHPVTLESARVLQPAREHWLLGHRIVPGALEWENQIDPRVYPTLRDHAVGGTLVFPAAAFVEVALAAAQRVRPGPSLEIEDLEIHAPLILQSDGARTMRCAVDATDGRFTVRSRARLIDEPWVVHATGRVVASARSPSEQPLLCQPAARPDVLAADHYAAARCIDLNYGPAFQALDAVWIQGREAFARLSTPEAIEAELPDALLHPSYLDAAFQLLLDLAAHGGGDGAATAYLPVRLERLRVEPRGDPVRVASARLSGFTGRSMVADFTLADASGRPIACATGVRFQAMPSPRPARQGIRILKYRTVPRPRLSDALDAALPAMAEQAEPLVARLHKPSRIAARRIYRQEVTPLLDALCAAFARREIARLNPGGRIVNPLALVASGRVPVEALHLLEKLVGMLAEDGVLTPGQEGWQWVSSASLPEPEDIWVSLLRDYPDHADEIIATGCAGVRLNERLSDGGSAQQLSPAASTPATGEMFAEASSLRDHLLAMADLVRCMIDALRMGRSLRVLELVHTAPRVLPHVFDRLDQDRCQYFVGTLDPDAAAEHAPLMASHPGVRVMALDAERVETMASTERFDLILLPDGIGALGDPDPALDSLQRLAARNALAVALEHAPSRAADLVLTCSPASRATSRVPFEDHVAQLSRHGFQVSGPVADIPGPPDIGPYLLMAHARHAGSVQLDQDAVPSRTWLLLQDTDGPSAAIAAALKAGFEQDGDRVVQAVAASDFESRSANRCSLSLHDADQLKALLRHVSETHGVIDGIVHLAGLGRPFPDETDPIARPLDRLDTLAQLLRACEIAGIAPALSLITAGAVETGPAGRSAALDPAEAAFWGAGRVAMNEHPHIRLRLIDLAQPQAAESAARALHDELRRPDLEDEIVLDAQRRYALRAGRAEGSELPEAGTAHAVANLTRLEVCAPGSGQNMTWHAYPAVSPRADEVQIAVRAAGLNFRDVMYAMGLLPEEAMEGGFAGAALGMELAGVITAVGPDVRDLSPGDEVVAFAPSSFSTSVVTPAAAVARKPAGWSFEAAATAPIAFFTAYYALHHLAHLERGQRVLIHGAAGGVGLAAIQLAKRAGAEIFATAGSDEKRDFLRLLGVDQVMDSRSLAFADEILERTGGEGVDVVLNSLAGEAITRSLRALRPFGRFLELGKRDFYENTRIGMRPLRNNISYYGIDADQLLRHRPELTRRLFSELMALFAKGELWPLPYRSFAATQAAQAFRFMQRGKHIGKIVLDLSEAPSSVPALRQRSLALTPDATYLVVGGLRGFGLKTAEWLASKGAAHLMLVSRSGRSESDGSATIAELRARGVQVRTAACDVTDRAALAGLLRDIQAAMPPLRGVVHAAMVVDDAPLLRVSREQARRVLAPKILGACNLHQLTADVPLDLFVLYSSATTLLGNPGQASYVAANRYLEALAAQRRAAGLPALCVAWGPILDAGYLARNERVRESLQARMGGAGLTSAEALAQLEELLLTNLSGVAVLRLDTAAVSHALPSVRSPKFSELAADSASVSGDSQQAADIARWAREMSPAELAAALVDVLRQVVAKILQVSPSKLETSTPLAELGMDSLMAVELVAAAEVRLGVKLSVLAMSEGPTIERLAEQVAKQMKAAAGLAEEPSASRDLKELAREVAAVHARELDRATVEAFAQEMASSSHERVGAA